MTALLESMIIIWSTPVSTSIQKVQYCLQLPLNNNHVTAHKPGASSIQL